ncbi:hypothetical protein AAU57_05020 [Nonlabens sp. YIK11]|uniref:DUF6268 family outer membrane beta-barrel protein n=1 Tax=Nonlabens sp. YIK11 TaxID=1453349 RepID=UPI0006DCECAF|nr:DUF6268 family outer membrane beta-barrel protein [Nonlabens sp. YIK11]KQC32751.1 hypothetical protein AAU57_05020 [Nonlabens sp. YIK11]
MRNLLFILAVLFTASFSNAQDYFDLFKYSYNYADLGNIDPETEVDTEVSNTNIEFYFPYPISAKTTIIGGFTYENTRLGLQYNADRSNLIMTRLNLGVKQDHGNKWSGTYVFLPKFASDFVGSLDTPDLQLGGLALFEKRYSSSYSLKFGSYVSTEQFGTTITPLVGLWYKSENDKFYINATLPIRTDVNYNFTEDFSLGANLVTSIKAYNLQETDSQFYVQEESIRFGLYAAYAFFDNTMILRGKVGYDTTDYGLYNQGDTVGAQILTFQVSGDDRTRLNTEFDSSIFFGLDLIWRTDL